MMKSYVVNSHRQAYVHVIFSGAASKMQCDRTTVNVLAGAPRIRKSPRIRGAPRDAEMGSRGLSSSWVSHPKISESPLFTPLMKDSPRRTPGIVRVLYQ